MSPLLKSELRLRLGPAGCDLALWNAGWTPRCLGRAHSADDDGVDKVLDTLLAQGLDLPRTARVCIEDEFLYYALLPASGPWRKARDAARTHLAELIGDEHLMVQTSLLADGRHWLAVAVSAGLVERLRGSLAGRGVELRGLSAALLDDLHELADEPGPGDVVVAYVRSEGLSLAALHQGALADVGWERVDADQSEAVAARLQGYRARRAQALGVACNELPLRLVIPPGRDLRGVTALSHQNGWTLVETAAGPDTGTAPGGTP